MRAAASIAAWIHFDMFFPSKSWFVLGSRGFKLQTKIHRNPYEKNCRIDFVCGLSCSSELTWVTRNYSNSQGLLVRCLGNKPGVAPTYPLATSTTLPRYEARRNDAAAHLEPRRTPVTRKTRRGNKDSLRFGSSKCPARFQIIQEIPGNFEDSEAFLPTGRITLSQQQFDLGTSQNHSSVSTALVEFDSVKVTCRSHGSRVNHTRVGPPFTIARLVGLELQIHLGLW